MEENDTGEQEPDAMESTDIARPKTPDKGEMLAKPELTDKPTLNDKQRSVERQRSTEKHDAGPGDAYRTYLQMEECLDKLKLLNYEQEFTKKSTSYKPLSKHYFATSFNTGEQFFMFTSTASWLIQRAGKPQFEMPQEFDDPNATVARILDECRAKEIEIDFPPNKLKSGAGPQNVYILDKLPTPL